MVLSAIGTWPMLEYELDMVQRALDMGKEVYWLMCQGNAPICPGNLKMKKRICLECKSRTYAGINWLQNKEKLVVSSLYNLSAQQLNDSVHWAEKIKFEPKASVLPYDLGLIDWYESAYSTLQTTLKELSPDLDEHGNLLHKYVLDFFQSYLAILNNLKRYDPGELWVFNGRITRFRPALRVAQREKIDVCVYEYPYQGYKRYIVFKGQYPHDFTHRSITWKSFFDTNQMPLVKKLALGDSWYKKRLSRIKVNYEKVFSMWQSEGLLPPSWNSNRRNISVFNSSEWESAGVPESRRWNYEDQFSALERIFQDTEKYSNLHFTFRIHPHMAKKDRKSADRFKTLEKYSNVTILSPESSYDTYALARASDIVLTFYSLVGVESAWLGFKVICLGPTPYDKFGCVYLPTSHKELLETLCSSKIEDERFPSIEMRKRGAQEFAFARLFSGIKPTYLLKNHYTRACMKRGMLINKIRANLAIYIFNRILSFPETFITTISRIFQDQFLRKEIKKNPWNALYRFIRDSLGGTVY